MKRSILAKFALVLFVGFVSTAMTVDVSTDDDWYTCHLVAISAGTNAHDYDCEGTCIDPHQCHLLVWQYTAGCDCAGSIPWDDCSGEFSGVQHPSAA